MKVRIVILATAGVTAAIFAVSLYTVYGGSISCCIASREADNNHKDKGTVYVLYAGSLVNTMEKSIGPAFQDVTGYAYQGEGHGSLEDAQMMINDVRSPDVFIGVGKDAMQLLANHSPPRATWWLSFASDQLVIAYNEKSPFAKQLDVASKNQTAWYRVLEQPGFKLGFSDPKLDPKGVYAVLLFKLASLYYKDASLSQYLNSTHASMFAEEAMSAELQAGAIDAIIAYKHEAMEQHLSYVSLPSRINFGSLSDLQYYSQVSIIDLSVKRKTLGAPVTFAVTIPDTSKNRDGALAFVKFILNDAHAQSLIKEHGFSPIRPPVIGGNVSAIPQLFDDH
ncbi:MAG TPA: extracellular solute-binding protein [Nitrososphaera sp.]|nr:extracellular solute-binding protein [Nitrososphaera sp.]